jgi:hypothetical protein
MNNANPVSLASDAAEDNDDRAERDVQRDWIGYSKQLTSGVTSYFETAA